MLSLFDHKHNTIAVAPTTILYTISMLLLIYGLFMIRDILTLIFLAFILMVALSPVAKKFQKYLKLPRLASIVVTYFLFISILVTFFGLLIPPLVAELTGLIKFINLPGLQQEFKSFEFTIDGVSTLASQVGSSVGTFLSIISSTFSGIFTTFTLFVMSFFLLQGRESLYKKVRWFTNREEHLEKARDFINDLEAQLGGWVRGELILMLVIGTMTYLGLTVLGIPYALPLAILAGLLEILPNIGPTIAAIPAIVIAFIIQGPLVAGGVLILNIVIQQLENNIIVPKVMNDNAHVSPLVSIIAILIGVKLGGFIGALLAVPLYIVIRTTYVTFFYQTPAEKITRP